MELDLKQFIIKKYGENTEVLRVKKDMHVMI